MRSDPMDVFEVDLARDVNCVLEEAAEWGELGCISADQIFAVLVLRGVRHAQSEIQAYVDYLAEYDPSIETVMSRSGILQGVRYNRDRGELPSDPCKDCRVFAATSTEHGPMCDVCRSRFELLEGRDRHE